MYISPIATANPRAYSQEELLHLFHLEENLFASRVFRSCGIQRRHLELTPELMSTGALQREPVLRGPAVQMCRRAIDQLDVDRESLAGIIVASTIAISMPTLAHLLHADLGLGHDVEFAARIGDGCIGGVACTRDAMRLAKENPGKHVLVVVMDLMSGHFGYVPDPNDRDAILNSCLFGDGCAAFLVGPPRTEHPRVRVLDTKMFLIPNTLDHMVIDHDREPPRVRLSKQVPDHARLLARPAVDAFLQRHGLEREQIKFWMLHPGGKAIIAGFQEGLGLSNDQAAPAFGVLRDYGNMGTPSSTYVMKAVCDSGEPRPGDYGMMVTAAPGVTMALMLVRWEE